MEYYFEALACRLKLRPDKSGYKNLINESYVSFQQ